MAKKVLIVDDDHAFLMMLTALLKRHGFDTVEANDGLDAMVKIQAEPIDLILLDIMMPEINGYDVCHHLRFDERYKHIPIILLTGRNQEMDARMAKLIGIEYMQKPLDSKKLMETIERILPTT